MTRTFSASASLRDAFPRTDGRRVVDEGPSTETTELTERHASWLRQFQTRHGRRPAVLHIGNIGNNAYILAKALNAAGVASDVLCYDYYHTMGCPEWEDADFVGDVRDQFFPAWDEVDLRGFRRPPWFAQGPVVSCLNYLWARRSGNDELVQKYWHKIEAERKAVCAAGRNENQRTPRQRRRSLAVRALRWLAKRAWSKVKHWHLDTARAKFGDRFSSLQSTYCGAFPDRTDVLHPADFAQVDIHFDLWTKVLQQYDLVMGYSTDGIFPLVVGRPYFAFEHGTIRSIPFEDTPTGRACSLTYRLANHAFITNADNQVAAQRLGLKNFSFLPHPLNDAESAVPPGVERLRAELRQRLGADLLLFHPSRQHWTQERHPSWEKGNDYLIEGFARFVHEVCPKAGAVFVNWGQTVDASRDLLARRGIANRVHWIEPLSNRQLLAHIKATDVLADQFYLGAFGGTMPKALMLGRPNLIYLDPQRHQWCLPHMPPVVNVQTADEIFQGLTRLYRDPEYAQKIAVAGKSWYRTYHSIEVVVERFLDAMGEVVV